jgi:hypothetical protein
MAFQSLHTFGVQVVVHPVFMQVQVVGTVKFNLWPNLAIYSLLQ